MFRPDRAPNGACLAQAPGEQYAVYFPDGGEAGLDLSGASGAFGARWLNIEGGNWSRTQSARAGGEVRLAAPHRGHWLVVLSRER